MPKIIKDLEARLIREAKKQIETAGYGSLTIRSVAQACGVGVGTVYNYFSSKDALLVTYMLSDWKDCIAAIRTAGTQAAAPGPVVRCIYDQLAAFSQRHRPVFQDDAAIAAFSRAFMRYHSLLRSQLAQPLQRFCESEFAAEFAAEALLTWTLAGKEFEELYSLLAKIF